MQLITNSLFDIYGMALGDAKYKLVKMGKLSRLLIRFGIERLPFIMHQPDFLNIVSLVCVFG